MVKDRNCKRCNKEFTPSKNDIRIIYCSKECRLEHRKETGYTTKWNKKNKEHVRKYRELYKGTKNTRRRERYANDEEYRKKIIEKNSKYRKRNPHVRKNNDLLNNYGITYEDYKIMKRNQGRRCKICNLSMDDSDIQFNVDHCHNTGKVRGILCTNCNFGIGHFKDEIQLLEKAIKYLRESEEIG